MTAGLGMMHPAAVTVVQERGRSAPGATSGLVGVAQFVLGALVLALAALVGPARTRPA